MNSARRLASISAAIAVAAAAAPTARAVNAVYNPGFVSGSNFTGGNVEVQGSSGQLDLPVTFQTAPVDFFLSFSVAGATANDTTAYTLLTPLQPSSNSSLLMEDPHTGAYLGTVALNARFSDIAYTNGQLYGIGSSSTSLQVSTIAANGATQVVLNQTMPGSGGTWRLSGAADGSALLAARAFFSSSNVPGFVVNPTSLAVSQITLSGTASTQLDDNVINQPANAVASIGGTQQVLTAFPGGGALGNVPGNARYGTAFISNTVSDEFKYNYSPSMAAVMQTTWNLTASPLVGTTDGLTRQPQVVTVSGPISISNYVTPDGTTLSNVAVTNQIAQYMGPQFGHTPFVTSAQNVPASDLSNRNVGQGSASLDLSKAERGLYDVHLTSSATADYSYASTVDSNRFVQTGTLGSIEFAYDPISNNLVGNGDAYLNGAGWQGMSGSLSSFQSQWVNSDPTNHCFVLIPQASYPSSMRQFLQQTTPDGPMSLSFTYDLRTLPTGGTDEIQAFLNGVLVADLMPSNSSLQTFQTEIDDPTLENASSVVLMFRTTSTAASGNFIDIGNISLTSIPEPTTGLLMMIPAAFMLRRRRPTSLTQSL